MEFEEIEKNKKKRIIIGTVYVTIFLVLVSLIFYTFKPKPSCNDGKKNQNESGIDCGGVCGKKCEALVGENIVVKKAGFLESGLVNKYDLYAEIFNPNNLLGSDRFQYSFKLKGVGGKIISEKSGTGFVLPRESKYIVENTIETSEVPVEVEFVIPNTNWIEFGNDYYQKPALEVINKVYNVITGGVGFGEAKGLLVNESPFDFATIEIKVILKDVGGRIIALNSTSMNTVKAGEKRDFRAYWPNRFPGEVSDMDVQADVNVFNSESFAKTYFQGGRFQELGN